MDLAALLHPLGLGPECTLAMLGLALLLDLTVGEPPVSVHPVVLVGRLIGAARRVGPRRGGVAFVYGAALTIVLGLGSSLAVAGLARWAAAVDVSAWWRVACGGMLLWTTFSIRLLDREVAGLADALEGPGIEAAREHLPRLCSRDASDLDEGQIAAAGISSLTENANDSVVAPVFWYALFGLPGAVLFRVVNTMDAMIGYRGEYEWLGKFAARSDDVLGYVPARITALALVAAGAVRGANVSVRFGALLRDARSTPSPNGGWPMASAAWVLGLRLDKPGAYALNGEGRTPSAADIGRARRLNGLAIALALLPMTALTAVVTS